MGFFLSKEVNLLTWERKKEREREKGIITTEEHSQGPYNFPSHLSADPAHSVCTVERGLSATHSALCGVHRELVTSREYTSRRCTGIDEQTATTESNFYAFFFAVSGKKLCFREKQYYEYFVPEYFE